MRFAIYSVEGTSLSWWKRLQDEGHQVMVYIQRQMHKDVGLGLIAKTSNYAEWVAWGRGGIFFFDCTDAGIRAELLRKMGERVVGGGAFCDRLEKERMWGQNLAESVGMLTPKTYPFPSISSAISWLRSNPGAYYFKPDKDLGTAATCCSDSAEDLIADLEVLRQQNGDNVKHILQEKLKGFALSTARWWNGFEFTGPFEGTVEHKKLMNDDLGPATGCAFNCLWFYRDVPTIAENLHFDKLSEVFQKHHAPPGIYDINALLDEEDGEAKFLEWTPRLGCDSEPTSQKGITDLGKLLSTLATGGNIDDLFIRDSLYASIRLSVPPYPVDDSAIEHIPKNKTCIGVRVEGTDGLWSKHFIGYSVKLDPKSGLVLADASGLVGLASASGTNPKVTFEEVYKYVKTVKAANLQYRTDAAERVQEDFKTIVKLGYDSWR